jgi:hypothetical protein
MQAIFQISLNLNNEKDTLLPVISATEKSAIYPDVGHSGNLFFSRFNTGKAC